MSIFHANEFVLNLPEQLKDRSVNVFSLTDEGPSEFSVVIARDKLKSGETLAGYVERQLQLLGQRAPLFRLHHEKQLVVDKQPAIEADYSWMTQEGKMHQRQVAFLTAPSGTVLLFTATCKEQIGPKWEAAFNEILASLRLRT